MEYTACFFLQCPRGEVENWSGPLQGEKPADVAINEPLLRRVRRLKIAKLAGKMEGTRENAPHSFK